MIERLKAKLRDAIRRGDREAANKLKAELDRAVDGKETR